MLVLKVWCLPEEPQERLERILTEVTAVLVEVPYGGVRSQSDFLLLFPKDQMEYGLGTEILVEAGFTRPGPNREVLVIMREELFEYFRAIYPKARVCVVMRSFDGTTVHYRDSLEG